MSAPVFLAATELLRAARPGGAVPLDGPEGRHAVAVRRLRLGEELVLTDGAGLGVFGTVAEVRGKDGLDVRVGELRTEPEPQPRITVVQALPKGDRGETAVETMTEVGVDVVVPWAASRCVTKWSGPRGEKALGKWRATAREAGKQSRRLRFPEVTELMTTRQVVELLGGVGEAGAAGVLHEEGSEPFSALVGSGASGEIVLVVGPEGGVSAEELAVFAEEGAKPYRLGPSVLRTSTAGTAAAAVLLAGSGRWA